ncbi:helix-turn-helix domain-containing protein [Deinococcus roseus]|uniref:Helix-turn-helix domain-containing protein n=1 Tax=Deinococcus roseus TaxID=392414 RepID=A0ABQ2CU40_9DEIO|nr:helix-turn-helix domain-containing protein [Deinococcus roseus]GGJ21064.1 hypothetical protein GCM10008938_04120 [Deinococcus roseus]
MTLNDQLRHLPKFLTVREVADFTFCHDRTVRRWIRSGTLSALETPEGLRIPRRELKRFLGLQEAS